MKTTWQKIYSFFGFWTYTLHTEEDKAEVVIYRLLFPFFFIRKVDLFRIDVSSTKSIKAQKKRLAAIMKERGEELPPILLD